MTKICSTCDRELDTAQFHRNGPKRRHSMCKECRAVGYKLTRSRAFPTLKQLVSS